VADAEVPSRTHPENDLHSQVMVLLLHPAPKLLFPGPPECQEQNLNGASRMQNRPRWCRNCRLHHPGRQVVEQNNGIGDQTAEQNRTER